MSLRVRKKNEGFNEIMLSLLITQYMGALGNFSKVIPASIAHIIYLLYNALFLFYSVYGLYYVLWLKQKGRVPKQFLLYLTFFIYVFISGFINTQDYSIFLDGVARLLGTAAVALYIGYRFNMDRICLIALRAQVIAVAMTWYLYLFFPNIVTYGDAFFKDNLIGLFTTKNTCAYEMAFGLLVTLIWSLYYAKGIRRILGLVFLATEIPLIFACHAVGSQVCVLLTIALAVIFVKQNWKKLGTTFASITTLFWVAIYIVLPALSGLLAYLGKSVTLTGRTTIWSGILQFSLQKNFWIGAGYGTFWYRDDYVSALSSIYSLMGLHELATGAHNLLLEMLLQVGMIGVILFISLVVVSLNMAQIEKNDGNQLVLVIVFFYTVRSLVERTFNQTSYDLLFFLIVIAYCIWRSDLQRGEHEKGECFWTQRV